MSDLADTFAVIVQNGVNGHLARDLAGRRSTHPIAYDVNAVAAIEAEIIFIVGADSAYIGFARNLDLESHPRPLCDVSVIVKQISTGHPREIGRA